MSKRKHLVGTIVGRYRLEPVPDSSHQWRLMELKRPAKGGRVKYVCIAIGTGHQNMQRLARKLS